MSDEEEVASGLGSGCRYLGISDDHTSVRLTFRFGRSDQIGWLPAVPVCEKTVTHGGQHMGHTLSINRDQPKNQSKIEHIGRH